MVTFFGPGLLFTWSTWAFLAKGKGAVAAFALLGKLLLFDVVSLPPDLIAGVMGAEFEERTIFFGDGTGDGDCPRPPFRSLPI